MRRTKSTTLFDELTKANNRHCDKHGCFECDFYSDDWDCVLYAAECELKKHERAK